MNKYQLATVLAISVAALPTIVEAKLAGAGVEATTRDGLQLTSMQRQAAIEELRAQDLGLPIFGASVEKMKGSFYEERGGAMHEAVDILSPRNTPVHAIQNGVLAKLFTSKLGGLTVYQFDPASKYVYYYAHLQNYADNLHEGDVLHKGQVIGYVGTSGNAPPNTPHLHFSISVVEKEKQWWRALPIDPYQVFSGNSHVSGGNKPDTRTERFLQRQPGT